MTFEMKIDVQCVLLGKRNNLQCFISFFFLSRVYQHAFISKKRRSVEKKYMFALHFVGWEEWIKGETHCGTDISADKVSLLNWSILNKINDEYVRVCSCDPLCAFVYTVWDNAECNVSNKRHKLH